MNFFSTPSEPTRYILPERLGLKCKDIPGALADYKAAVHSHHHGHYVILASKWKELDEKYFQPERPIPPPPKEPEPVAAPSPLIQRVREIGKLITDDVTEECPYPWCAEFRVAYAKDIEAAGGAGCQSCKRNGIKNKFARMITDKLKETHE